MYKVTNKKTGYIWECETLEDAQFLVRCCVVFNNKKRMNSDRKTNYIIEELQK